MQPDSDGQAKETVTALVPRSTYQDLEVVTGDVYDYYVVSVDANGVESVPSNIVSLTIN